MTTLERLINILVAETDMARALLVVIEEKQEALIRMNADRLSAMVERERALLKPTKDLERERIKLLSQVASEIKGLPSGVGEVRLSELAKHLDENSATKLTTIRGTMKGISKRIQERNHQNRILLESSSRFVKNTIHILTGDQRRRLIDQKI